MIATVTTLGDAAQTAGVVVAALLGAAVLLVGSPRARAAAMLGALALTPVLLVANIWSTPQFEPLRERPGLALAAGLGGLVVLAVGALLIHRRPELLALAAAAALPFRVPIESGGDTANLLVPLYVVIAAGVLAYAAAAAARAARPGGHGARRRARGAPRAHAAGVAAGGGDRPLRRAGDVLQRLRRRAGADDLLLRPVRAALRAARADPLDGAARRPLPGRPARARRGVRRRSASSSTPSASCCSTRRSSAPTSSSPTSASTRCSSTRTSTGASSSR